MGELYNGSNTSFEFFHYAPGQAVNDEDYALNQAYIQKQGLQIDEIMGLLKHKEKENEELKKENDEQRKKIDDLESKMEENEELKK